MHTKEEMIAIAERAVEYWGQMAEACFHFEVNDDMLNHALVNAQGWEMTLEELKEEFPLEDSAELFSLSSYHHELPF